MISDEQEELPQFVELILGPASLNYQVGGVVWYKNAEWIVDQVEPKRRLVLKRIEP